MRKIYRAVTGILFLLCTVFAHAQENHSFLGGRVSKQIEDRFDQCYEDLNASWVNQFIDSLVVMGRGRDGEPYACMANVLKSFQFYLANDSLSFFKYSNIALEQTKRLGSNSLYYSLLANQIGFHCEHNNIFKAQDLAKQLIIEAKASRDSRGLFNGYLGLALTQSSSGYSRQAIKSYESALKFVHDDNVLRSQILYSMGYEYFQLRDYRTALTLMEQSIEASGAVEKAPVMRALCYYYLKDNNKFLSVCPEILKHPGETIQNDDDLKVLRSLYHALNYEYTTALNLSDSIADESIRNFAKAEIFSLLKRWDMALEYNREASHIRDSIRQGTYSDMLVTAYSEINLANELRQKDDEIRRNHLYSLYTTFGIIILLLIITAILVISRQRTKWQKRRYEIIKKYNTELAEAKEKAEEANRLKTMFLQNMSHDLRSPLNAIVGFSQLLGLPDGFNSEEEKEKYNSYIANNSEMLILLFEDILNIEDIEQGKFKLEYIDTFCNDLCRKILKCVEYRVPAGVELNFNSNVDDDFCIITDGRRVQQVLVNFLTNACKHTTEGEICLDLNVDTKARKVIFSVTDTGEGVAEEIRDNLFERYIKLGGGDSHGIGLNICTTIAEKMEGSVSLDTTYTNGAKFDFVLDLKSATL